MNKKYKPECGDGAHGSTRFMKELYSFLEPKGMVLDCGSGIGLKTNYMKSKGLEVISIDIDMSSLRKLKNNIPNTNGVICGDIQHLPFKPDIFDSILASEVLEHLPNPNLCTKEVHRVMKRNAVAAFTTPVFNLRIRYLITIWRKICGIEADRSHLHVFSTRQMEKNLRTYFFIEDTVHRGFTELLVIKFGFDKNGKFDKKIVWLCKRCKLITLFASKIWIKAKKLE